MEQAMTDKAHNEWVRRQVQPVLDRVQRGEANLIDHDTLWAELEAYARRRMAERDKAKGQPRT